MFFCNFAHKSKKREMDRLPNDPNILYSAINMLLRDNEYDNLDELCYAFGTDRNSIEVKLAAAGFKFNETENKFW